MWWRLGEMNEKRENVFIAGDIWRTHTQTMGFREKKPLGCGVEARRAAREKLCWVIEGVFSSVAK